MNYQPNTLLVTGGAGFIGANFIRYILSNEPHLTIVNIDKLTYAGTLDNLKNLPNAAKHHFIHGDITNQQLLEDVFQHFLIDTVVHFAAESHVDRSIATPFEFVNTNVLGTFTLLETARKSWQTAYHLAPDKCRFHHISTDEVFGSLAKDDPPFLETNAYKPNSPYSATKAASDHLVNAYHHTYGLPITISHCSNNYGPYQHQEKFIPTIIKACLRWKPIPIYGNGQNIRDWLYVEDHCRGIMAIIKNGNIGQCYNLGGNNEWDNISLANIICQRLDEIRPTQQSYQSLLTFIADRAGHDFRYAINTCTIEKELKWRPLENFKSGIDKTIAFYLDVI